MNKDLFSIDNTGKIRRNFEVGLETLQDRDNGLWSGNQSSIRTVESLGYMLSFRRESHCGSDQLILYVGAFRCYGSYSKTYLGESIINAAEDKAYITCLGMQLLLRARLNRIHQRFINYP